MARVLSGISINSYAAIAELLYFIRINFCVQKITLE